MTASPGRESETSRLARAALARIVEPGDGLTGRWLAESGPEEVWRTLREGGPRPPGLSPARWDGLLVRTERAAPERDLAWIARLGGRFVCPGDREWPSQLNDLGHARPLGLWVRGGCSLRLVAVRSVALVGARKCTDYGRLVALELGATLAGRGWTVVSGGAEGVDGAAHQGALHVGGATVGVLACGVDVSYPAFHHELLRAIAERGLLVAELPPGDHPTRGRFVQRNRVIAALTRGTVVVEAAQRSGSLITARHARRLGRHLMAVPGPVTSGLSAGTHRLIREEATPVGDAGEIVELVGEMGELAAEGGGPAVPRDLLAPQTARVLDALPATSAVGAAAVAGEAGMGVAAVEARLRELSTLGFVERAGGRWQLRRRRPTEAKRPRRRDSARA
ncbi:DNA-processing protein DprA [Streptomyces radicis]|uniref:DNA-protecting protein DprA n=1 Tax=Streptomyces radicis TaxID=1750517 RepID=A0A3A9WG45_9ACTN|nr:DNA-processing protein DprA [Streptomyces radicis]RKN06666.1 DNA-protecting protein DprA [Streptomyces radicis]RKN19291.1 DNA-protecting protein DprA [Streptomyces radicis]